MRLIFYVLVISWTNALCNPLDSLSERYQGSKIAPPHFEPRYMGKAFTKELIVNLNPREKQLMPIELYLEIPKSVFDSIKDISVLIDTAEIIFVTNKTLPLARTIYKGHLVFINEYWPLRFPLNSESRIIFRIRYKYQVKKGIIQKGLIETEIYF